MMSDYYIFSGHFYVPQNTEWNKFVEDDEGNNVGAPFNSISEAIVKKYDLNYVSSYDEIGKYVLIISNDNQKIYIEYEKPHIGSDLTAGYTIAFEKIEN